MDKACLESHYDLRGHRFSLYQSQIHYDTRKYNYKLGNFYLEWSAGYCYFSNHCRIDTFKASQRLDTFWQNQEVIYNWKTDIHIGSRS